MGNKVICECTSQFSVLLKLAGTESVTDYLLRAETNVARLKEAKYTVSDSVLVAMVLKGLPDTFKSFSTVMMQQDVDKMSFSKFKAALVKEFRRE